MHWSEDLFGPIGVNCQPTALLVHVSRAAHWVVPAISNNPRRHLAIPPRIRFAPTEYPASASPETFPDTRGVPLYSLFPVYPRCCRAPPSSQVPRCARRGGGGASPRGARRRCRRRRLRRCRRPPCARWTGCARAQRRSSARSGGGGLAMRWTGRGRWWYGRSWRGTSRCRCRCR